MDFRILGPVHVRTDTGAVRLGGPRGERILAMLVVHHNRLVSTDALVDALWPTDPPATARVQVRNCVAALRRALVANGLAASALSRSQGGYVRGRHDDCLAELGALVHRYPTRDRLGAEWMRVLQRSGRTAEALDVFAQIRRQCIEDLGVEPGQAVYDAHREILRGPATVAA